MQRAAAPSLRTGSDLLSLRLFMIPVHEVNGIARISVEGTELGRRAGGQLHGRAKEEYSVSYVYFFFVS